MRISSLSLLHLLPARRGEKEKKGTEAEGDFILRVALLPHQTADENKFSYLNQTGIIFCFTFHFK
jgi:hypothetical protein